MIRVLIISLVIILSFNIKAQNNQDNGFLKHISIELSNSQAFEKPFQPFRFKKKILSEDVIILSKNQLSAGYSIKLIPKTRLHILTGFGRLQCRNGIMYYKGVNTEFHRNCMVMTGELKITHLLIRSSNFNLLITASFGFSRIYENRKIDNILVMKQKATTIQYRFGLRPGFPRHLNGILHVETGYEKFNNQNMLYFSIHYFNFSD